MVQSAVYQALVNDNRGERLLALLDGIHKSLAPALQRRLKINLVILFPRAEIFHEELLVRFVSTEEHDVHVLFLKDGHGKRVEIVAEGFFRAVRYDRKVVEVQLSDALVVV